MCKSDIRLLPSIYSNLIYIVNKSSYIIIFIVKINKNILKNNKGLFLDSFYGNYRIFSNILNLLTNEYFKDKLDTLEPDKIENEINLLLNEIYDGKL